MTRASRRVPSYCLLLAGLLLGGCSPGLHSQPPVITSTPVTVVQLGALYHYAVVAIDPQGEPLQYALTTAPDGMQVDGSGVITWTPPASGDNPVALSVTDTDGAQTTQAFVLHVQCASSAFPFTPSNVSAAGVDWCQTADVTISGTDSNIIDSEDPSNTTAFDATTTVFQIQTQSDQSRVGVYFVKSLQLQAGAKVQVLGSLPLVIVSLNDMTLSGTLLAPPGTAGGSPQGVANSVGLGVGGGQPGTASGQLLAGSGGSYCGAGGAGASETGATNGTTGAYGSTSLVPLQAGSSGGTGAIPGYGSGGGAIQLTAGGTLNLLQAGAVLAPGGGAFPGGTNGQEAGGGGSGGSILLEANTLVVSGTLAVNGGGGGQGGQGDLGQDGQSTPTAALGGQSAQNTSYGGNGSAGATIDGSAGADQAGVSAGGGGGGAGRIRMNALSGSINFAGATLSPSAVSACVTQGGAPHASPFTNGVWLGYAHAESATQAQPAAVSALLQRLYGTYNVSYIFVNVGHVDSTGHIVNVPPHLQDFLASAVGWRSANQAPLHLVAWLNGLTDPSASPDAIDLSQPTLRAAVVAEAQRLVSAAEPGSYVAPGFEFDGVQLDFEPSGDDPTQPGRFEGFESLMGELRAGFAAANRPETRISAIAPQLGTASAWRWSADQYYLFAQMLDMVVWLAYDTQLTASGAYQARVQEQATDILRAIWGEGLSQPRPQPPYTAGLMVALPAYPATPNHDPAVENIHFAAIGLTAAVTALKSANDPAVEDLIGAAVYLQSDGTGNDGFASWTTDWAAFAQDWLGN